MHVLTVLYFCRDAELDVEVDVEVDRVTLSREVHVTRRILAPLQQNHGVNDMVVQEDRDIGCLEGEPHPVVKFHEHFFCGMNLSG